MIGGLHHVGITVSDLDRSLAFYRGLLGLHIEARAVDVAAEDVTGIPGALCSIADLVRLFQNRRIAGYQDVIAMSR